MELQYKAAYPFYLKDFLMDLYLDLAFS